MSDVNCLICNEQATAEFNESAMPPESSVNCRLCDRYRMTESAQTFLSNMRHQGMLNERQIATIRGYINHNQVDVIPFFIDEDRIKYLFKYNSPSVADRAIILLKNINEQDKKNGSYQPCSDAWMESQIAKTWSFDKREVKFLFNDYLINEKKFIELNKNQQDFKITPKGFSFLDEITRINKESNKVFCAMSFSKDIKVISNIYEEAILPAVSGAGYDAERVDTSEFNSDIVDEILSKIRASKFVIADLTGNNHNVYFEAGFAAGLGLPVIYTCQKESFEQEKLYFDIEHYNFILWDKIEDLREKLKKRVLATIGQGKKYTQI